MLRTLALRLLRMLVVLWVVSIVTFSLVTLLPGDPVRVILGQQATDEQVAYVRGELGLDDPLLTRYWDWVTGVLHLDFGQTLVRPIEPVSDVVGTALPVTLELAVLALLMGLAGGLALGSLAAYYAGSRLDRVINSASFALVAVPAFVLALPIIRLLVFDTDKAKAGVLVLGVGGSVLLLGSRLVRRAHRSATSATWLVSLIPAAVGVLLWATLPAFPREGWVPLTDDPLLNLRHAFLPAFVLALGLIPLYAQVLRADMMQTLRQNFITISRAKGMTPRHLVLKEALRPSLFSLITVAGLSFGGLVGGSVIVEVIFNLPGLGRVLVTSIQAKDYAVVQISVLVAAALFLLLNTVVDIAYLILDPRLRRAGH